MEVEMEAGMDGPELEGEERGHRRNYSTGVRLKRRGCDGLQGLECTMYGNCV
jgi:hypothetical protein